MISKPKFSHFMEPIHRYLFYLKKSHRLMDSPSPIPCLQFRHMIFFICIVSWRSVSILLGLTTETFMLTCARESTMFDDRTLLHKAHCGYLSFCEVCIHCRFSCNLVVSNKAWTDVCSKILVYSWNGKPLLLHQYVSFFNSLSPYYLLAHQEANSN